MSYWQLFKSFTLTQKLIFFLAVVIGITLMFTGHQSHGVAATTLPSPVACPPSGAKQPVMISLSDTTFTPGELTIQLCDEVVITNIGKDLHEPAFGPHPTHLEIPGWEAEEPLQPGQSFRLTIDRPGNFSYHDHLHPRLEGHLTVK